MLATCKGVEFCPLKFCPLTSDLPVKVWGFGPLSNDLPVEVWGFVRWVFSDREVVSLVRFCQSGVERMLRRIKYTSILHIRLCK